MGPHPLKVAQCLERKHLIHRLVSGHDAAHVHCTVHLIGRPTVGFGNPVPFIFFVKVLLGTVLLAHEVLVLHFTCFTALQTAPGCVYKEVKLLLYELLQEALQEIFQLISVSVTP